MRNKIENWLSFLNTSPKNLTVEELNHLVVGLKIFACGSIALQLAVIVITISRSWGAL